MNSHIYEGRVSHCRLVPCRHYFLYKLYMMYLDLEELPELFDRYWFWSARGPALAWFRRKDHAGDHTVSITETIRGLIYKETGARHVGPIRLLTHLRYFAVCMNPVSFYFCWNMADTKIDFIVAEVHNTPWNETHCYVLDNRENQNSNDVNIFQFAKMFHVSPFMKIKQSYEWLFEIDEKQINITMDSFEGNQKMFNAAMQLNKRPVNHYQMNRILIAYPLITTKVITAIYWQAFKLWMKKVPFCSHPKYATGKSRS